MRHLEEQQLWALAAGESVPSDGDAAHLKGCRACTQRMGEMVRVRSLAGAARVTPPSTAARVEGLDRFERAMRSESEKSRRWLDRRPLILPALGLSALAGAGAAIMVFGGSSTSAGPVWAPPAQVASVEKSPEVAPQAVAQVEVPAAPSSVTGVAPAAPAPRSAPRKKAEKSVPAAHPAELAAAPIAAPAPATVVEVEVVPQFAELENARELLADGEALRALDIAMSRVASKDPSERVEAVRVIREIALQHPSSEVLSRVDGVVERSVENREALMYLGCESAVQGKRHSEAVRRCREFVTAFPRSVNARNASYTAGHLSRTVLGDCAGAVEDYSRASVFVAGLGSIVEDALFWRASCLNDLGRKDEARTDLEQYLARYPSRKANPDVAALRKALR